MTPDRIRLPFLEQIDFFRKKLNLPTEAWDDIWQEMHDRAFVVAGAMEADLLDDLRKAVDAAIAGGDTIQDFRKKFKSIVEKYGWHGWTGEGTQAGEAWRTRVIYTTNIATSHAAGRWQQLNDPDLLKVRPFWRYIHNDSVLSPRPQHQAWGNSGLTLPHDHPFWKTHFPPNGWGCRCRVTAVRGPGEGDATTPPEGWDTTDPKTGAPPGIDKGWAYAPGRTWHPDLDKYPYVLARQVVAENMKDGVFDRWQEHVADKVSRARKLPEMEGLTGAALSDKLRSVMAQGERYPVAVLDDRATRVLGASSHTVWLSDDTLIKQTLSRGGQDLPKGEYQRLQDAIEKAEYVEEAGSNRLIYYHDHQDLMVAVIKVSQNKKDTWLLSLRRGNAKELNRAIESGKAKKW